MRATSSFLLLCLAVGCGPAPIITLDAGALPDAPVLPPDGGPPPPPYACDGEVTVVNGVLGDTETLMLDTTMTAERPRDLGPACGNIATTAMWARQEVIEYHVPGTGLVGVSFDTARPGTAMNFNTLVQVRTECGAVPVDTFPPNCFDDQSATEARARGGFTAMGGDTVFLIVTAYSDPEATAMQVDEGPVQIDITPIANTAPTITDASVLLSGEATIVQATATDAEGPILGYALSLYNAMGQLDFDGDGMREPDEDVLIFYFDTVSAASPYVGDHEITPEEDGYILAQYARANMVTQAGIVVFDESYAVSARQMVDVENAAIVGPGDTCDRLNLCASGSTCNAGVCELSPAAAAACGAAMPIAIAIPVDTTPTTATVMGNITAGTGVFVGSCTNGAPPAMAHAGREAIYSVELTGTGPYDVTFSTARPGTAMRDTVVYVLGTCGDPTSELGCQDDISGSVYQSTVTASNVMPGTIYVVVEMYGGAAGAFELLTTVSL